MTALAILARLPAWFWLVAMLATWGGWNRHQALELKRQNEAQQVSLLAVRRAAEQTKKVEGLTHEYAKSVKASRDRAASVSGRLRDLPASSPAAAAACRDSEPPAAALSEQARSDLVALALDAEETADALRVCQAWAAAITAGQEP